VAGFEVHRELVARNSWFAQVLPNAEPLLLTIRDPGPGRLRQLAEEVLGGPELDVLERWARRRRAARVRAGARPTRASAAGGRGMSRLRATVVHDAHAMSDRVPGTETDIR
jgi:hypothetical protein